MTPVPPSAGTSAGRHRLPLPVQETLSPEEALRRARVRRPAKLTGPPDAAPDAVVESDLASADALLWRLEEDASEPREPADDSPWDWTPWRRAVGDRKLVVDVETRLERRAVQALSEAGFVLQRRERVAAQGRTEDDDARAWLVARADDGYVVRVCRESDEAQILELFAPAFHADRSAEHWRWKYLENPWGRRWISLAVAVDDEHVSHEEPISDEEHPISDEEHPISDEEHPISDEEHSGELAAHYAGYPVPFVRWGETGCAPEELPAVQIGDTMTAPAHRTVGLGWTSLLGRAVRHHFARFGREGVAFYYGFNTGKIRNFNLRFIEGRWAGTVGYYRCAADELRRRSVGGARGDLRAERLRWDDLRDKEAPLAAELDDLFRRAGPAYGMLVRRDAAWLRWRYAACPDRPPFFAVAVRAGGRLVGWGVFRRHVDAATGRSELRWVDALLETDGLETGRGRDATVAAAAAGQILREALRQPEAEGLTKDAEGVAEIAAWFAPRPRWWVDALGELGFERLAEPDDLGLIYLPFDDPRADETFLDVYYTWGDSDLT